MSNLIELFLELLFGMAKASPNREFDYPRA